MKIRIQFKSPESVSNAVDEAVKEEVNVRGMFEREVTAARHDRAKEIQEQLRTYILYGEYLTVEFDTETGTMEVVKVK